MKISVIKPVSWEKYLGTSPTASVFHHSDWSKFVADQFGADFTPIYVEDDKYRWLVPLLTELPWTGSKTMSTASIGYGGPLALHAVEDPTAELLRVKSLLQDIAHHYKAKNISCTLYPTLLWQVDINTDFTFSNTCCVALPASEKEAFEKTLSGNVRTAIRKSQKAGITVRELDPSNRKQIDEALALLHATQTNVGSNYHTQESYFVSLCRLESSQLQVVVYLAYYNENMVGMTLGIMDDREFFHLLHGWDRAYAKTCVNQALIWAMMRTAIGHKSHRFNMGESHSELLLGAKLRWGGHVEQVPRITLSASPNQ